MPKKLSDASKITRQQKIYNILRHHDSEEEGLLVSEIHERLLKDDINTSQKTISRDLAEMSTTYNIESGETKPTKYFCSGEYDPEYQLTFSETELLSMALALNSLSEMSDSFQKSLCEKTEAILASKLPRETANSFEKLKALTIVSPGIRAIAGIQNSEAYKTVLKALRDGKMIECENHSPYQNKEYRMVKRTFSPLKMNLVGGEQYLFAVDKEDGKVKRLKLCRMKQVKVLDQLINPAHHSLLSNVDAAIGGFGDPDMPIQKYVIHCDELMGILFQEKMMHPSQKTEEKNGEYIISFEVNPSMEIPRYLAGWAKHIRKVEPAHVMEEMQDIFKAGLELAGNKKKAA